MHGEPDDDTEVPRDTLVAAPAAHSTVRDTRTATGPDEFWVETEIDLG